MPQPVSSQPFLKGSIIWEKKGPLPVWAWALIALGLVLGVVMWRNNKSAGAATTAATGTTPGNVAPNQKAPPVFIMPQGPAPNVTITVPEAPAGGGRDAPAGAQPPMYLSVKAGQNVNKFFWDNQLDYSTIEKLNPSVFGPGGTAAQGLRTNTASHDDHNLDTFLADATYKIR